jgi:hypothetical protein
MADDYTRAGETFRADDIGGKKHPASAVFEHLWTPVPAGSAGARTFTVDATAGGIALVPPTGATHAIVRIETADVVYVDDGTTTVTATDGNGYILAGEAIVVRIPNLANFKMIRKGGTSAKAWVSFYRVDQ